MHVSKVLAELRRKRLLVTEAIISVERLAQGQERSVPASAKKKAGPKRAAVKRMLRKQSAAKGE